MMLAILAGTVAAGIAWFLQSFLDSQRIRGQLYYLIHRRPIQRKHFPMLIRFCAGAAAGLFASKIFVSGYGLIHLAMVMLGSAISVFLWMDKQKKRRRMMFHVLPDFLDMMALGVSAGLNNQRAWENALHYTENQDLREVLELAFRNMLFGGTSEKAFKGLSESLKDPAATMVFSIFSQALRHGIPLQTILTEQANSLRRQILMTAEKRVQTMGTKLLFPIFIFIFPTVFMILLGPIFLRYVYGGSLF